LKERKVPIVFCSAKTRAEQEVYRKKLGIPDPFIVENGGAIYVPTNYFNFHFTHHRTVGNYFAVELGISSEKIRKILKRIEKDVGRPIKGFGDLEVEEVAKVTGLSLEAAALAKQREYDETLIIEGTAEEREEILRKIKESGLACIHGGRFYDVTGGNDKGRATEILIGLFEREWGEVRSVGLGDSLNDLPMLSKVDVPVLVQKPHGTWEKIKLGNIHRVEGVGPVGWKRAVKELILGG